MQYKTVRRMKVVQQMTGAKANFVSLVDHGANQQGFAALKRVGGVNQEDKDMGLQTETKGKKARDVAKAVFPGDTFADEAAVKAWLDKAGFSSDTVEKEGTNFVVKSPDYDKFGDLTEIEGEDGVKFYAGTISEDTATKSVETTEAVTQTDPGTPSPEDGPAAAQEAEADGQTTADVPGFKDMEVTAKFSAWMTEYSGSTTLAGVLNDGVDGLPPGIYEVNAAMYTALRNNLIAGDFEGARQVVADFGDLVVRMSQLLEHATVSGDMVAKLMGDPEQSVKADTDTTEEPAATAEATEQKSTEAAAAEETPAVTDPAPTEAAPVEEAKGQDMAALIATSVAKAVAEVLTPVISSVTELKAVVADGIQKQEGRLEELSTEVTKTASRVDTVEGRSQTRKGLEDETANESAKEEKSAPVPTYKSDPLHGNLLGFRSRSRT